MHCQKHPRNLVFYRCCLTTYVIDVDVDMQSTNAQSCVDYQTKVEVRTGASSSRGRTKRKIYL